MPITDPLCENVLLDCYNKAQDIDKLDPHKTLDELCKIIFIKLYDELFTIKQLQGMTDRFKKNGCSNISEVASNIHALYFEASNSYTEIFCNKNNFLNNSRRFFNQKINLSDTALNAVVEILQCFSFNETGADIKEKAFYKIVEKFIHASKNSEFTIDSIAELAIEIIQPKSFELILDPFCGSANFLKESLKYIVNNEQFAIPANNPFEFIQTNLHGIENSDQMGRLAIINVMMYGEYDISIHKGDTFSNFSSDLNVISHKNTKKEKSSLFDIVITHPPSGSLLLQEPSVIMDKPTLRHKKKSTALEILGLEISINSLKPGGRLAIVLPEHLMNGASSLFVRDWLEALVYIKAIFFFSQNVFLPFENTAKICLCIFQKLPEERSFSADDKTFLCQIENLGYDSAGCTTVGSEIMSAAAAFHSKVTWS